MRRGDNMERRAGSFCVLVDGDDQAAPPETELPKSEYVMEVSVMIQPSFLS